MYTEIESMKDMLEYNLEKKKYVPVLLLGRFTDTHSVVKEELQESIDNQAEPSSTWEDVITYKEAEHALHTWREQLLTFLSDDDAGCVINSGNVLVLIKESKIDLFMERTRGLKIHIRSKGISLETDGLHLSDDLSRLFLNYA